MLPPTTNEAYEVTHRLEIQKVFDSLREDEKEDGKRYRVYAHHLARACWHGSRITLRQSSAEAEGIFDFILELHRACGSDWDSFVDRGVTQEELDSWLEFGGMFMSNLSNYYPNPQNDQGDGNSKVVPGVSAHVLQKMANISTEASLKLNPIIKPLLSAQPAGLGYPSETTQSGYYPGMEKISKEEIQALTGVIEANGVEVDNTRLRKHVYDIAQKSDSESMNWFEVLQVSSEKDPKPQPYGEIQVGDQNPTKVFLSRGDHSEEMQKICFELAEAQKHALTTRQETELSYLIESFRTGDYKNAFWDALKTWAKDKAPRIEHTIGFYFPYRDPSGLRPDWLATVGIADSEETKKIDQLVARSTELLRTLPWAIPDENDGKGPFEHCGIDTPDFAIIRSLASVSFTVWEALNVNLNVGDGKNYGVKNLLYSNRMALNSSSDRPCYYAHPSEADSYMKYVNIIRFIMTSIHELIGHGSGKLLAETAPGEFNFDPNNPPISPVTGQPIRTWYKPKESWNSVFGKLALTVEECRAFLFADYFIDNKEILALFGYDENSSPTADDLIYYSYIHIGVEGLRALRSYKVEDQAWSGDHDQALFAILNHILQHGDGVISVEHDTVAEKLFVHVDRSKITSHGKPAIGQMLCKIHIWHSTADITACHPFYEALSTVSGDHESWRQIVASNPEPKWKFVQPNTFLREDGTVELREYEASNIGIIQSFFERNI